MEKKNIVILGSGFGGLRAAALIAKKLRWLHLTEKYAVQLIDRHSHHTYTPLLYEVATTSMTTANMHDLHDIASQGILLLIDGLPINFVQGEVEQIELAKGEIRLLGGRNIQTEYLILALGSEVNFFGIPGLKEHALTLKTFLDALTLRTAVWNLSCERKGDLRIVVGGGGSTGVELVGELMEWCGELEREISPKCRLEISIVEAAPTILMGFDARVVSRVQKRLARIGVTLMTNKKILSLEKGKVLFDGGESAAFDLFVWTGGVKASSLASQLPLAADRGRPLTDVEMRCAANSPDLKFIPRVYGLGDCVCFVDLKTGKPTPQVARAALTQADIVAYNVIEDIKKAEYPAYHTRFARYRPLQYPYVIPVGGKYAVAKIGPLVISGFLGWVFKGLIELNYFASIMPLKRALKEWMKGLRIFMQNDRLG